MNRNLAILFCSQAIFASAALMIVTLGGIVGNELSPDASWSTLPVSLMVAGTALTSVPAALFMRRVGRPAGFATAALVGMLGALTASVAMQRGSFAIFCLAALTIGATIAFSQQFRFAAAESVDPLRAGKAISLILLGSIVAALVAPEIVKASRGWELGHPYRGAMLALAALYLVAAVLLALLARTGPVAESASDAPRRPLSTIVRQPLFLIAMLGGVIGQGVMAFIMTATPLSMHVMDGHDMDATAGVIRAHVMAMYLPSLVSGWLAVRIGTGRLMAIGIAAMGLTLAIGLSGKEVLHYWWALVLLGVGWNFLFVGGTTLLVSTYRPTERFGAQAVNELGVFGGSAAASLLAGTLMHRIGWEPLLMTAMPPLALMALILVVFRASFAARAR